VNAILRYVMPFVFCFTNLQCFGNEGVFSIRNWINIPDGTSVAPFFNPKDCTSHLAWDLLENVSIAAGEIEQESAIQTLPLVTQITFALSGSLQVIIKDAEDDFPIVLSVESNEAVLMKPGSLFQFRNAGKGACRVLYIVSPAYLFELDNTGMVIYDDAFIVSENWEELKQRQWYPAGLSSQESRRIEREESYQRLSKRKRP
jgi:hypothetical protein